MKIKSIEIQPLHIPFNEAFTHASMSRSVTEAVIAKVTSYSGKTGYGEGCPRSYVTNESITSADAFCKKFADELQSISSLTELQDFEVKFRSDIDKNPAAFCSVELAFLDLFGKCYSLSIEQLLGIDESVCLFDYTAILGISNSFEKQAVRYAKQGFKNFKVKLSGNIEADCRNISFLYTYFEEKCKVRADANNLWNRADEAISYIAKLKHINEIEEPVKTGDYASMHDIVQKTGCRVILDESFKTTEDFKKIEGAGKWIVNLRVSKMGGLIRSLRIVSEALDRGIPIIIGAQVGETSILTRASLVIARAAGKNLFAQEGAFGTYLLKNDITPHPLQFGEGGRLDFSGYLGREKHGLGLLINL